MIKIIEKLEIIVILQINIEVQQRFNAPNEISAVFYNGSNYVYHFIAKELANEFEG